MKTSILVASCLLLTAPAFAQNPASGTDNRPSGLQAGSPAGGADSRDEEVLCRRIEANTGSRISGRQRVCMTRRQWREYERNN